VANSNKNTNLEKEIGQRIMILRGNETQEELASAVGVSREIIQHWERGTRHIKADHLRALAEHFGISVDYLLGLVGEGNATNDEKIRAASDITGLDNSAIKRLIAWNSAEDRCKQFSAHISRLINSEDTESLLGFIGEYFLYSYLEERAANKNDLDFANSLIDMQMARLWNVSRLFSNILEALGAEERRMQNGKQ